jgi:hypothetical protein
VSVRRISVSLAWQRASGDFPTLCTPSRLVSRLLCVLRPGSCPVLLCVLRPGSCLPARDTRRRALGPELSRSDALWQHVRLVFGSTRHKSGPGSGSQGALPLARDVLSWLPAGPMLRERMLREGTS